MITLSRFINVWNYYFNGSGVTCHIKQTRSRVDVPLYHINTLFKHLPAQWGNELSYDILHVKNSLAQPCSLRRAVIDKRICHNDMQLHCVMEAASITSSFFVFFPPCFRRRNSMTTGCYGGHDKRQVFFRAWDKTRHLSAMLKCIHGVL